MHLFGADTVCKSVHNAWNEEQYAWDLNSYYCVPCLLLMFILQSAIQFDSWWMNITIKSLQFLFSFPYTSDVGGCSMWPVLVVLPVSPANKNTECLHGIIISSVVCSTRIYGTWHKRQETFRINKLFFCGFLQLCRFIKFIFNI